MLRPIWSYEVQIWGCAKPSQLRTIEAFQSISLRIITSAPWYVSNLTLHKDLNIVSVVDLVKTHYKRFQSKLNPHPNPLIAHQHTVTIPDNPLRLLKRHAINQLIKSKISSEVNKAGMYSVQLDTTQDITTVDQCSILRYMKNASVQERLVGVVKCTGTKGIDFVDILMKLLKDLNIDPNKCVGNSTDGASNMQGKYNGFNKKLSEATKGQVHIWCYAHVLNLVMCDTTNISTSSMSLFELIHECAVFF
ncbi:zinc finger MYM-type protein 6-like [Melanaphis sacchari]|uniref:zinc finger MYM-type protein 6-like n=1 Tax=Melanaphis sacchari TaxID=742174 RepID=UPI000DC15142|nr:zinc finger MYM-type protein 6-like [Melanaphis sacchari]